MDKVKILRKVIKLHKMYHEGKIPTLSQHELHPDLAISSRENYLYFTLAPCLNFQRSSPALWALAFKTWNDPETNYLFLPEKVVKKPREQIQKDLMKHKLALQPNKHTDIWITICKTFHELYSNDPRKLFKEADWNVAKILNILCIEKRKSFPYLSGPKLSNYWLYILTFYTDAKKKFKNMQEISIIPDTHVIQSTVKLGITPVISSPLIVAEAWKQLLAESDLSPSDMHAVLWNWSRNNFLPEV